MENATNQRFTDLEARFRLVEESVLLMRARIKTLERNNTNDSRHILSSDDCGGCIPESRNNPSTMMIKNYFFWMVSLFHHSSTKTIFGVGRTQTTTTTSRVIPQRQPTLLRPSSVLSDGGADGAAEDDGAALITTAAATTFTAGSSPATEQSVVPTNGSSIRVREKRVRPLPSPTPAEERRGRGADASFHFVPRPGLDGYSESLSLAVDDVEDCNGETSKLSDRAKIRILHTEAVRRELDHYDDPDTGYTVFTAHHLKTRDCCGSSCRHCPWGHRNVPGKRHLTPPLLQPASEVPPCSKEDPTRTELSTIAPPAMAQGVQPLPSKGVPPKSRLYTRKGDSGWGTLYNDVSILKSDPIYEAIGTVDELNSSIGLAAQMLTTSPNNRGGEQTPHLTAHTELATQLETVQAWLLDIGSSLCTPRTTTTNARKLKRTRGVCHEDVTTVERWIDEADVQLTRILSFILPGGSPGAAALHVARTVCRRAERYTWPLLMKGHGEEVLGIFLNRLSDFLFVAARLDAAVGGGGTEQEYKIQFRVDRWQRQVV